jgi:hypothetical protein
MIVLGGMDEDLVVCFRDALFSRNYDEALRCANNYEKATGHVIDCSEASNYPYLCVWASAAKVTGRVGAVFDVIARGGGVTVASATLPQTTVGGIVNAMTLAARSPARDVYLDSLVATSSLRPVWGFSNNGRVPLSQFLFHTWCSPGVTTVHTEALALKMLACTPIECLVSKDNVAFNALKMAFRLRMVDLVAELLRRGVSDSDQLTHFLGEHELTDTERSAWWKVYIANHTYFTDIVPTLEMSFDTIVPPPHAMPKPILDLIARFLRGPFEL